jgi:flagellar P-ring protein FlgI
MIMRSTWPISAAAAATILLIFACPSRGGIAPNRARIADLTIHQGDVPRRIVGYGIVVGLDGTGDRSLGSSSAGNPTVRSVVNLLRRFEIEVPAERLRLRNVAAVLVTAEVSPYLRAGGRFDVRISALGDATSLRNGTLWITPLLTDPGTPPVATAQGTVRIADDGGSRGSYGGHGNSGLIPQGGLLEADPPPVEATASSRILLRDPDIGVASRIAGVVNAALGQGTATVEDPGAISLTPPSGATAGAGFMAAIDTLAVTFLGPSRIVISEQEGTIVAGGDVTVGTAVVHHKGITLQIGGTAVTEPTGDADSGDGRRGADKDGFVRVDSQASVQDVAAGLSEAGATPEETIAIFEALRVAGALKADLVVR